MSEHPRTVFVLGAGFTRAFFPSAPLLTDNYDIDPIRAKIRGLEYATRILDWECRKNSDGQINIERLMTRLEGRMPYDFEPGVEEELSLLLASLKECFVQRIQSAAEGSSHAKELALFARYCVTNRITCITFNYDDFFDRALWEVKKSTGLDYSKESWHPDGGYGFFCRPSWSMVSDATAIMDVTSMLLLKLHGSVNWLVKRGYTKPYSIDAIVHDESWLPPTNPYQVPREAILAHLESTPFIVPPVLTKSVLTEQPILRVVWSHAFRVLREAERVVFAGYSLPLTDISAGVLFSEGIRSECDIQIVSKPRDKSHEERLLESYRAVFPHVTAKAFCFKDALAWANELAQSADQENGRVSSAPESTS